MARHRQRWRIWQRHLDPAAFVFLDETSASTNMVSRYGWWPKGQRLVDATPPSCRFATCPSGGSGFARWPLEDHHLPRWPALQRHHRTARPGWRHDRPDLSGLCRASAHTCSHTWRCGGDGQSRRSQGSRRPGGHRRCRRQHPRTLASGRRRRTRGCRPTHPTSIHDPAAAGSSAPCKGPVQQDRKASSYSPSSRPSCVTPPPDAVTPSGAPLVICSLPSAPPNAPTTSKMLDM